MRFIHIGHEANDMKHPHSFALHNKEKFDFQKFAKIKKKKGLAKYYEKTLPRALRECHSIVVTYHHVEIGV